MATAEPAMPATADQAVLLAHEWFEHNSGWAPPDDETLAEWLVDGVCRCPDECLVGARNWCEHGLASWWLILRAVDERAVLAHFGIGPDALLGEGGEARVFALGDDRVLRLPNPGTSVAALDARRALLDGIAGRGPVATSRVIEHRTVAERTVVIEERLPGRDGVAVLGEHGTDRTALVRHHLDVAASIADLPCPTARFGELWDPAAITTDTFAGWSIARLRTSLTHSGQRFAHVDAAALTADLVRALPQPEPTAPVLVHLDAFLGNMLADQDRITALLDFGPMAIAGPRDLDPLVAIAYLAPEITPTATPGDHDAAVRWAEDHGLGRAVPAAERWIAGYWAGCDDERLERWCARVLGPA